MTDQPQGPIYEYMMGTFDLQDATWIAGMNDMLNNFGLAGWRKSVATLLDARHLLVVMERRWPTAAEYAASQPQAKPVAELDDNDAGLDGIDRTVARVAAEEAEASEYDDEAEAMMAAKVAEVIPWAARPRSGASTGLPKAPANGRRKGVRAPQRKKHVAPVRNKAAT